MGYVHFLQEGGPGGSLKLGGELERGSVTLPGKSW